MVARSRGGDRELEAIRTVVDALQPLEDQERSRVLEYVLKRLQMATVRAPTTVPTASHVAPGGPTQRPVTDIRSLKEEKQPRSANEMAALVAYYISELAPPGERSETVNATGLRRYFKMAGFRLPSQPRQTLPNAAAAGYLENTGRGEYRLNPVGYNLVVHGLPREGGSSGDGVTSPRRGRNKKSKRSNRKPKARG